MKARFVPAMCIALLAGCSEKAPGAPRAYKVAGAPANKFGMSETLSDEAAGAVQTANVAINEEPPKPGQSADKTDPAAQSQIAYRYSFGFRIASDQIAALQKAHIALCDAMGPKCRVLRTSLSSSDEDRSGDVALQVAANEAGTFEKVLSDPAQKLGGELVSSERDGEDLSKNIVDTEAKLQSRLVLRGKLTDILRGNKGSVDELIKAEKAVADVNEEIDASASELQGYRTRIRFSDVSIEYRPTYGETQLGFARPIMTAARSIGTTLGITVAALIYMLTALVPIGAFIAALRWVLHRFGLRIRFWRKNSQVAADAG